MTVVKPSRKGSLISNNTQFYRRLAVYIGAVSATVVALATLRDKIVSLLHVSQLVAVGIACSALVIPLVFEALPAWLERRRRRWLVRGPRSAPKPGYFRLHPYQEEDQTNYKRADEAHLSVLSWIKNSTDTALFLTSRSGVGKTSLLQAYVIPELNRAEPPTRTVIIRSFGDPIGALRDGLLKPEVIWKQSPKGEKDIAELVTSACKHIAPERLLLIFDQFEELVVIHSSEPERLAGFRAWWDSLIEKPAPGLTVLFVIRSDYLGALEGFGLPPMRADRNWRDIVAFTRRASSDFLKNAGLPISDAAIDSVLSQAMEVEETRGLIRPCTLNMLGKALERASSSENLNGSRRRDIRDLMKGYMKDCIKMTEVREVARPILSAMITEAGTKLPLSVKDLSGKANIAEELVRGSLLLFSAQALVRRIDEAKDVWEISHDFVARLLHQVLSAWRISFFRRIRPWLAPASLVIWAVFALVLLPLLLMQDQREAYAVIARDGGSWITSRSETEVRFSSGSHPDEALVYLQRIPGTITKVDLSYTSLTDPGLGHLEGLHTLTGLDLEKTQITDAGLAHLSRLHALTSLSLNGTKITDAGLTQLGGLHSLKFLYLEDTKITNAGLTHLSGLRALETLDLDGTRITDAGLAHLVDLPLTEVYLDSGRAKGARLVRLPPRLKPLLEQR